MLYKNRLKNTLLALSIFFCSHALAHAETWLYEVRKGDNLWSITANHLIDISYVNRVKKLNNIIDPWRLKTGSTIKIPGKWIKHFPSLVRVQRLRGHVQLLEKGSNQPTQLTETDIVLQGDTLITGANSSLTLVFLDNSTVTLMENSQLTMEHLSILQYTGLSDSHLQLEKGHIETQITPKKESVRRFQITTPASVTSVRGTNFRISAEPKISKAEVLKGLINIKEGPESRPLPAGFGVITVKGQKPSPLVKLPPAPNLEQLPDTFDQVPVMFSLPELREKQGYRVQIAETQKFKGILFNKVFYSANIRTIDLPDGEYTLRVRSIDKQKLEGLNAQQQLIVNAKPEPPFLLSPKDGEAILPKTTLNFNWSRKKENRSYHFQVAKNSDFTDILIDKPTIKNEDFTFSEELPIGKYFWRVASIDKEGDGPFSNGQLFRRISSPPELKVPELSDTSITFRTRKGLAGQRYHFQLSKNEGFTTLLVDMKKDEPLLIIPRPENGGEYFIRIRAIDSDGFIGPFSTAQSIRVPYNYYWILSLLPLLALLAL